MHLQVCIKDLTELFVREEMLASVFLANIQYSAKLKLQLTKSAGYVFKYECAMHEGTIFS